MPNYHRWRQAGGYYFFTLVTEGRRHILTENTARRCLRSAMTRSQVRWPFEVVSIVLLPDHLHTVWLLPEGDADYSTRWNIIKRRFTISYLREGGQEVRPSLSKQDKRERGIWQRRYWEHCIRDFDELNRIADYIHWNPVKHELVARTADWEWSSFHRYVANGYYPLDWGDATAGELDARIIGGDEYL